MFGLCTHTMANLKGRLRVLHVPSWTALLRTTSDVGRGLAAKSRHVPHLATQILSGEKEEKETAREMIADSRHATHLKGRNFHNQKAQCKTESPKPWLQSRKMPARR